MSTGTGTTGATTGFAGRGARLALGAHALLAGSMALARALGALGPWSGTAVEVALAGWAFVLVAALGAAALGTLRARRPELMALAVLLGLSLARRRTFDAFDLVYVLAVALACALVAARGGADDAGRAPRAAP